MPVPAATSNGHMRPVAGGQATRRAVAEHHAGQEASLAGLIGETVALHLAPLLGDLAQRVTAQPECFFCLTAAKQLITQYQIAVKNAAQASEPVPGQPEPPAVNRSVTRVPVVQLAQGPAGPVPVGCDVPACWDHIPVMPPQGAGPVSVGLVDVAGRPLSFRRG